MDDEGFFVPVATLLKLGDGDLNAGRRILRSVIDQEVIRQPIMGPTPQPPNVRAATEADEDAILELSRLDIAENASHIAPFSEKRTLEFIRLATRDNNGVIGVIDAPEGLAGMVSLQPLQWWWSEECANFEQFSYVHPDHRASRYAADLVKFCRWHTDQLSIALRRQVYLLNGVMATKQARGKIALYRRLSNPIGIFCAYPDPGQRD